jgi:hypothetical protein
MFPRLPLFIFSAGLICAAAAMTSSARSQDEPGPDLQKQIDDAIKELDKLEKIIPDQADGAKRQLDELRQQMRRMPAGGGNGGIIMVPGLNVAGGLNGLGGLNGVNGLNGLGLLRGGTIGQGRWGVALQPPTPVLIDQLQLPPGKGLVVMDVRPDSPAAKAGLLKHDILMEVDGKPASSDFGQFQRDTREIKGGVEFPVSVIRQGKRETIKGMKLPEVRADQAPIAGGPLAGVPGVFQANLPGINGANVQVRVNANENEIMKTQVNGDDFAVELVTADLRAKVSGKRENGIAIPAEIFVQDGDARVTARAMDQVPERYRPTINRMIGTIR